VPKTLAERVDESQGSPSKKRKKADKTDTADHTRKKADNTDKERKNTATSLSPDHDPNSDSSTSPCKTRPEPWRKKRENTNPTSNYSCDDNYDNVEGTRHLERKMAKPEPNPLPHFNADLENDGFTTLTAKQAFQEKAKARSAGK